MLGAQEAWLSMQTITKDGLQPATRNKERVRIIPIYNTNEYNVKGLMALWASKTPAEAYGTLLKPDVTVTNASDKAEQLQKILQIDDRVRGAQEDAMKSFSTSP